MKCKHFKCIRLHTEDIIDLNFHHYYLSVVDLQVNFSSPKTEVTVNMYIINERGKKTFKTKFLPLEKTEEMARLFILCDTELDGLPATRPAIFNTG